MLRFLIFLMLIGVLITGCVPQEPIITLDPSASCNEIIHPALLSVPFHELAQRIEQAEEWILTQFPTTTIEIGPNLSKSEIGIDWLGWSYHEKIIALHFENETLYINQISEKSPTLGQLLRCYGEPDYYTLDKILVVGTGHSTAVELELWYVDQGLYFNSTTWGTTEIRRYNANSPIVSETGLIVWVMPAGTAEEMIRNRWGKYPDIFFKGKLALLKEWPENFTELVLEE